KRSSYRFFFKNQDMDFYLMCAILNISHYGASIGEIMYAAKRIKENNPKSWTNEWLNLARKCQERANEANYKGDFITARQNYFHAYTYYRLGIIGISVVESKNLRDEIYFKFVSCFQKGASFLNEYIEPIKVPWNHNGIEYEMPGYFMSPDNSGIRRPTIIILNGGEMYPEDQYFWGGAEAISRGFNVIAIAYEGQRAIPVLYPNLPTLDPLMEMKEPGFHKFIVDYTLNRPETDSKRVGVIGFSSGAYQAMHQASFDDRIKALVLAAPLYDINALLTEEIPSVLQNAPPFVLNTLLKIALKVNSFTRVSLEHASDTSRVNSIKELMDLSKRIPPVDPKLISCPVLCLVGEGDSDEQIRQFNKFYDLVSSKIKDKRIFTMENGASMHCQIDNFSLLEEIAFDWLNKVFGIN
ncbi:MAG: hypothetical protein P8Y97_18955, partial [Candidatus Lokiarchaeota archaeon]